MMKIHVCVSDLFQMRKAYITIKCKFNCEFHSIAQRHVKAFEADSSFICCHKWQICITLRFSSCTQSYKIVILFGKLSLFELSMPIILQEGERLLHALARNGNLMFLSPRGEFFTLRSDIFAVDPTNSTKTLFPCFALLRTARNKKKRFRHVWWNYMKPMRCFNNERAHFSSPNRQFCKTHDDRSMMDWKMIAAEYLWTRELRNIETLNERSGFLKIFKIIAIESSLKFSR